MNDGRAGPEVLPDDPGDVFADSAYRESHFGSAVRAKGGASRVVATGVWARTEEEAQAWLRNWNQPIHRIRGRIEKIFGTWKRSYGLRRMRWRGLAKAAARGPPHRHRLQPETLTQNPRSASIVNSYLKSRSRSRPPVDADKIAQDQRTTPTRTRVS